MERAKNKSERLIFIGLIIFYSVGVIIHLISSFSPYLKFLTPIFLISIFSLIVFNEKFDIRFLFWLLISYVFTFFIEVMGVKTGLIFGEYRYGENLGLKFLNVPLVIGLNWISLILGSISFTISLNGSIWVKSILAGLLMISFDFVLEQVAPSLDYWHWQNGVIPFQNFVAWFFIAFVLTKVYIKLGIANSLVVAKYNFVIQFLFFIVIYVLM